MIDPEAYVNELRDQILETEIKSAGLRIQMHLAMLQVPGAEDRRNMIKSEVVYWRRQMERLVASRRPQAVNQAEQQPEAAR